MKKSKYKFLVTAFLLIGSFLFALEGSAQRKLPDGSIIYNDGTRRLSNGTVIHKSGSQVYSRTTTVVVPERSRHYEYKYKRKHHSGWMPPGQAKKIYGGSARDYAPGQQKKWRGDDYDHDHDHGHGHGKHHD